MNRFRSDQKWKDRWGSGFIVLAILMLVGAYWVGDYLANPAGKGSTAAKPDSTAGNMPGASAASNGDQGLPATAHADLVGYPKPLSLFLVQAGAFTKADNANAQAGALMEKGLPAVVSQSGQHHKVFIGAYRTKEAALKVKAQAEAASGISLYTAQIDLPGAPTALPAATTGGIGTEFRDAVAALSGYLHESANVFESQVMGQELEDARAAAYSQKLSTLTATLKTQAGDPAVGRLLSIAEKVSTASAQQAGIAVATGHNPDAVKSAMQSYLTVLGEFRAWADTASAS